MKKIFLSLIIFIVILFLFNVIESEGSNTNFYIEQLVNENKNLLETHPYYIAKQNGSLLEIYFSKERLTIRNISDNGIYYIFQESKDRIMLRRETNGSITKKTLAENETITMSKSQYISTNQNVYFKGEKIFTKNSGHEHDKSKEKEEMCNDLVMAKENISVYESAGVCYDIIATLEEGCVVKRTKTEVNEINGHKWDKVELSDGTEGYIFSDTIEIVENAKEITFFTKDKKYNIYLSSISLGVELNGYEYYFVRKNVGQLELYLSKKRIYMSDYSQYRYYTRGSENTIKIKILGNGSIAKEIVDLNKDSVVVSSSEIISSNQNIYYKSELVVVKNSGYIYNKGKEKEETCNDLVTAKENISVYESAGVCYDIIATLEEGCVVKRIKTEVNEVNGHKWDKVELSDGTEGYIFSDTIEIVENTKEITFAYSNKIYEIYISSTTVGVNLDEYEYYFVRKNVGQLELYLSKKRIYMSDYSQYRYYTRGSENTIKIKIWGKGSIAKEIVDLNKNSIFLDSSEIISSNQDIYYRNSLVVAKKYGYSNTMIKTIKAYCKYNKINDYNGEIDGIYGDDLFQAIIKFQEINELSQNGLIDRETFNAMGFNNSKEYDTYFSIASNYIVYKNPYGPTPYDVEDSESGMQFELGRKKAEYKKETQEYYDLQDSKYDTMSVGERINKEKDMIKTEVLLKTIATFLHEVYPNASKGIEHYLSKAGGIHFAGQAGNIEKLFNEVENSEEQRELYKEHTKKAIEHMLTVDKATYFSMINPLSTKLPITATDWFGLYGTYALSVEGSCFKKGNSYVAVGYCYARDYYDFDKVDDIKYIVDTIKNPKNFDIEDLATTRFADLHYAGKAKFFYVEGKDDGFELMWTANEEENNNEK